MRSAGIDPKRCVSASPVLSRRPSSLSNASAPPASTPRRPSQPVSRHGVKLVDGLPVDRRLRCWACDTPLLSCPARLECVPCLEIFRARADVLGHDGASFSTTADTTRRPGAATHSTVAVHRRAPLTRALAVLHPVWERAFFCTSECFCKSWCVRQAARLGHVSIRLLTTLLRQSRCRALLLHHHRESHRSRHGATTSTPSRSNPVVHSFPGAQWTE